MNTKYLRINPEEFRSTAKREVRGVEITIGVSPYDVPRGVQGKQCGDIFEIRFNYLEPEEQPLVRHSAPIVTLLTGTNSGRIYGIDVNLKEHPADIIRVIVERLEAEKQKLRQDNRLLNYGVIEDLITKKGPELVSA